MSNKNDLETLVTALSAVSPHKVELPPYYAALAEAKPLTLRAILVQKQLLRDYDEKAHSELLQLNKVVKACRQISPTLMPDIPLGF
jgi:hypothetical protein